MSVERRVSSVEVNSRRPCSDTPLCGMLFIRMDVTGTFSGRGTSTVSGMLTARQRSPSSACLARARPFVLFRSATRPAGYCRDRHRGSDRVRR
jgi:hypothetical protein